MKEAFPGEPDIPIMLGSWIPHHPVYAFENYGKETSLLKAIYNRWTGNQEISRFREKSGTAHFQPKVKYSRRPDSRYLMVCGISGRK